MGRLWSLSLLLVVGGLLLVAVGSTVSPGPAVLLTGLLLVWAGIVKVVVVHLWRGVANPEHAADEG